MKLRWVSQDVQEHKQQCQPPRLDPEHLLLGQEEPDHAAEHHVDERVDPERGQQDEKLRRHINREGLLMLDADAPEDEADRLPEASPYDHPTERFSVPNSLPDMQDGGNKEQDAEDDGGG